MNPTRSKSLFLVMLAAAFSLVFATGCGNKKKEAAPEKPKMDTGNTKPIVPATKAPETP